MVPLSGILIMVWGICFILGTCTLGLLVSMILPSSQNQNLKAIIAQDSCSSTSLVELLPCRRSSDRSQPLRAEATSEFPLRTK